MAYSEWKDGTEQENFPHRLANPIPHSPRMQVEGLSKLIQQAILGSQHAIQNPQAARHWLEEGMENLGDGSDAPRLDPILPGGILRIHLRSNPQSGADPDGLFEAFLQTAPRVKGAPDPLHAYDQSVVGFVKESQSPLRP